MTKTDTQSNSTYTSQLKKLRSERIYDHLCNNTPVDITGIRLGDFAAIGDENPVVNYHILILTDNDRGFSYNMVMPWTTTVEPDLDDMVLFIKELRDTVDELYAQYSSDPDVPLHLATNYNELQESGIERYLDELTAIAKGSMDDKPLPERLAGQQ